MIGRSGSGKSTLGNLIMRFYAPDAGEILLDGTSIKVLDLNWLRNNVTLVQQQSVLFNETIFKNIAFGQRDHGKVTSGEIKEAIKCAYLHQTINDMPQGLDTLVGAGSMSVLSGGQRQRVAIARARLRDSPILILDESTSALDYISRTKVMEAIRKWRKGKTTIVITHDISQVQNNDFAYCLDEGEIVQEGFRRDLEKTGNGPFATPVTPSISSPIQKHDEFSEIFPNNISHLRPLPLGRKPSVEGVDSLDIPQISRSKSKALRITSMYGNPYDNLITPQWRSQSSGLMSPLSPFAHHLGAPEPAASKRKIRHRQSKVLPMLPVEDEKVDMSPTGSPVSRQYPGGNLAWGESIEMVNLTGNAAPRASRSDGSGRDTSSAAFHKCISSTAASNKTLKHKIPRFDEDGRSHQIAPVNKILATVWPTLTPFNRLLLIIGFFCAAIHAACVPVFSWVFSQLLGTFYLKTGASHKAFVWSMAVLGIAFLDSLASYFMHYLLERCGQAWVDKLREEAFTRILEQPRSWFDKDENTFSRLTECLDRNAEEMRNLVGRFAGFVFVAVVMMSMSVVWSTIVCWKLTLVTLATGPVLIGITRGFEAVSGRWEQKSNDAGDAAGAIFTETFGNIRTVRALTLESYFHQKYNVAIHQALLVGIKRAIYSGLFFGLSDAGVVFVTGRLSIFFCRTISHNTNTHAALIFYYGGRLAASKEFQTKDIMTVFSMLLFSISNANAIIAFSKSTFTISTSLLPFILLS